MAKTTLKPMAHREIYFNVESVEALSEEEKEAMNTGLTHAIMWVVLDCPAFTLRELLEDIKAFYPDFSTSNIISVKRKKN